MPVYYTPKNLLLQWHITERCNLRCQHCYQHHYQRNELNFTELLQILEQFKELLSVFSDRAKQTCYGHITVTGGEPFARQDFLELLAVFAAQIDLFSFAILTNGSLIDQNIANQLYHFAPSFVQVSLEGSPSTHDRIRGQGNFAKTVNAIQLLKQANIPTLISFTAHKDNFTEFPYVAQIAKRLKVDKVWADRLIPTGQGAEMQSLDPVETKEFFHLMQQSKPKKWLRWLQPTEISMRRALQFLVDGGQPYYCKAGESLLTVQPNGDLYPCRRMPILLGNLQQETLLSLYDQHPLLNKLRDPEQIQGVCQQCSHVKLCRGGLKCLSYAITGDPFQPDPGCWLHHTVA